jgi:hypothetical protein
MQPKKKWKHEAVEGNTEEAMVTEDIKERKEKKKKKHRDKSEVQAGSHAIPCLSLYGYSPRV